MHNIYLYSENTTEKDTDYILQGPVLQFTEERNIENIESFHSGHIKFDQIQNFTLINSNFEHDVYDFINFDSAHYLYEMQNSPDWLLASQALATFYWQFTTLYIDKITF